MAQLTIPGYQIEAPIASGGMASVYLALQESLDRRVALKVLKNPELPAFTRQLLNEGRLVASLSHRNIITVHDVGVVNGHFYISMEYIEGGDLRSRIKEGMIPDDALNILQCIGNALEVAHENGIIHRDVKPANILFRPEGTPLLADFGIAKNFDRESELSATEKVLGTPHYLSPEQASSDPVDGRADLYSLGVILYEMLTGNKPYEGESALQVVYQHLNEPPPSLPPNLQAYQPLLDKMLAKDPDDRFADVSEMLSAVMELRVNCAINEIEARKTRTRPRKSNVREYLRTAVYAFGLLQLFGAVYMNREALAQRLVLYMEALEVREVVLHFEEDVKEGMLDFEEQAKRYLSWEAIETDQIEAEEGSN